MSTLVSIFEISCEECGEEIFQIVARQVVRPGIAVNGEIFATCAECGHTAQYIGLDSEGNPIGKAIE